MGKVGTCLVTLAGLLLAAGAQTFTGKESARQPGAGQPSRGPGGGGAGGTAGTSEVWFGFLVFFCIFFYYYFFFLPSP